MIGLMLILNCEIALHPEHIHRKAILQYYGLLHVIRVVAYSVPIEIVKIMIQYDKNHSCFVFASATYDFLKGMLQAQSSSHKTLHVDNKRCFTVFEISGYLPKVNLVSFHARSLEQKECSPFLNTANYWSLSSFWSLYSHILYRHSLLFMHYIIW